MKDIKWRYFACTIMSVIAVSMWLGRIIIYETNFPEYIFALITWVLIGAILLVIPFKWRILQFSLIIVVAGIALSVFAISMSITMTFKNLANTKLNILCVDTNTYDIRRASILPRQSLRLVLCMGDNPNQFRDKIFAVLATDKEGNVYYQGLIKIAELEKNKNILINSPLDATLNEPNDVQTKFKTRN